MRCDANAQSKTRLGVGGPLPVTTMPTAEQPDLVTPGKPGFQDLSYIYWRALRVGEGAERLLAGPEGESARCPIPGLTAKYCRLRSASA